MKYFSLLTDETVSAAAGEKIIPKKEFELLLSGKELLEDMHEMKADYAQALEEERQEVLKIGYKEGFEKGLHQFNEHILAIDETLKSIRMEVQRNVLPLALKAAKKIVGTALEMKPELIVDIVSQALKPVREAHVVKIGVSKEDFHKIDKAKSKFKTMLDHVQSLTVEERPNLEKGECIIETETGIINAGIENQWKALEAAFKRMSGGK